MVSISITVLKALKDRAVAGHRKFPAASDKDKNKAFQKMDILLLSKISVALNMTDILLWFFIL